MIDRGGVEDTRLEAKAKDTKKIRGQGQPFQEQNLSRPRIGMLEAKAKDQGHRRKRFQKKNKQVFKSFFQAISNSLAYPEVLIGGGLKTQITRNDVIKIFPKRKFFVGQRYRRMEDLKSLLPVCT